MWDSKRNGIKNSLCENLPFSLQIKLFPSNGYALLSTSISLNKNKVLWERKHKQLQTLRITVEIYQFAVKQY